ncbi:hypothetical protein JQ625_28315 [Bradyrhizobium diazoefficiens]|nr:hypothetical protein [Bradyrhizobium diazoefficiens]MBR0778749.1 hypothetical protein [Bradyrhizobium diazoefficiens]
MADAEQRKRFVVNVEGLPALFPTHRHSARFWESLGRTIATFGFLEEVLGKAIFAFTATTQYPESEVKAAFEKWLPTLEKALTDQLANLIDTYGKAVRTNSEANVQDLDGLLDELRKASIIRNVLCHGSWPTPDASGKSLPLFVNRRKMVWDTPIDIPYLEQTQKAVAKLACEVMTTVTQMGWQFPGSRGPGKAIFEKAP